jgi:hypothetical protein
MPPSLAHLFSIEELSILLALLFASIFIIVIIIQRTASQEDSYKNTNRLHFIIGNVYLFAICTLAYCFDHLNIRFFFGMLTGLYIYYSLHYVFLFPLIGICKKSISVNILESIFHIQQCGEKCTRLTLAKQMTKQNVSIDHIRSSRLDQMIFLKLASRKANDFQITTLGKIVHELGNFILNTWNQKRL